MRMLILSILSKYMLNYRIGWFLVCVSCKHIFSLSQGAFVLSGGEMVVTRTLGRVLGFYIRDDIGLKHVTRGVALVYR